MNNLNLSKKEMSFIQIGTVAEYGNEATGYECSKGLTEDTLEERIDNFSKEKGTSYFSNVRTPSRSEGIRDRKGSCIMAPLEISSTDGYFSVTGMESRALRNRQKERPQSRR